MQLTRDYVSLLKPCKCGEMVIGGEGEIAHWPPPHTGTLFAADSITRASSVSYTPNTTQHRDHREHREEALHAAQYMDLAIAWLEQIIDDPNLFPVKTSAPFPVDFIKNIVTPCMHILSAILSHQYVCHYQDHIQSLGMCDHLGTLIMHIDAIRRECGMASLPLVSHLT